MERPRPRRPIAASAPRCPLIRAALSDDKAQPRARKRRRGACGRVWAYHSPAPAPRSSTHAAPHAPTQRRQQQVEAPRPVKREPQHTAAPTQRSARSRSAGKRRLADKEERPRPRAPSSKPSERRVRHAPTQRTTTAPQTPCASESNSPRPPPSQQHTNNSNSSNSNNNSSSTGLDCQSCTCPHR